jgi:hypothetical protein
MKSTIFWDITQCIPLRVNPSFAGTYRFHLQGRKNELSRKPALNYVAIKAGFLFGLFFYPEDGGDMFFRNVGWHSTDYTALYPRR